jgi:predicted RND superfamily exporter protein
MSSVSSSTAELVAEHEFWEGWFEGKIAGAPAGLRGGFQTSPTWTLTETETELIDGAWTALALSLVFAFVVLLGASRSFRLALLATISVGSSAASLLGCAVLWGWNMGVIEAVCTMVLVGLSLDYVLHVAGAYVRTPEASGRRERAKGALRAVGLSVVSGASTTVGAAAFLLGCTLTFFTKFGLFVAWTLTSSLVQAVVVFPAMCAVWGPENVGGIEGEDEEEEWTQADGEE